MAPSLLHILVSGTLWMASMAASRSTCGNGKPARVPKIDVHHHFVPDFYAQAVEAAGGDPSGWPTPKWSVNSSLELMNDTGIETAILSVTAPGAGIIDSASGSAAMARRINEYAATIRDSQPAKFGFFAAVPDLVLNITAVIEEIDYALDVLKADGITLFTRYGKKHQYLGNPAFEDVWAHLDRRKAVVFIHPTHPVDTELINPILLQPSIDYPHETTRTVTDMLISGTRARYPNSKVILSHAGGTLPYLINRLSVSRPDMYDRFMKDAKSFHYDLALSSAPIVMKMLIEFVGEEKLLIGSDFPYAPLVGIKGFAKLVDEFEMRRKRRERIYWRNAAELFPRLVKEWEKKGLAKL